MILRIPNPRFILYSLHNSAQDTATNIQIDDKVSLHFQMPKESFSKKKPITLTCVAFPTAIIKCIQLLDYFIPNVT